MRVIQSLIAVAAVTAGWALFAKRFEQWHITTPLFMALAGLAVGATTKDTLGDALDTEVAQHVAEIILAFLLFVDATEVKGGLFGKDPRSALRLLFIALPLSIGAAVLVGVWLLSNQPWALLLLIACVVMPIDFAPVTSILRDDRIPLRIREILNVEGGYNDGIVSPLFIFALALAGARSGTTPGDALAEAFPAAAKAILVGISVGAALAIVMNACDAHELATEQSKRIALVAIPLLAYGISVAIQGNGFVASFACGIAFHYLRRSPTFERELELLDDVGFLLTIAMWFVVGSVSLLALATVTWSVAVFCLCALTILRVVPVALSMLGSQFSWPDRFLIGWLGPRGTTSIVFGLLAFNVLDDGAAELSLVTMVVCVLGSVLIHGGAASAFARARGRAGENTT